MSWRASYAQRRVLLSTPRKVAMAVGSGLVALVDPSRADMVAALGETTGEFALRRMHARMKRSESGRAILAEQPRLTKSTLDFGMLRSLPPEAFGAQYAHFMDSRGFSPDERPLVQFVESPELAYVMQRYREVHDLWHVLTGLPTTISGELAQKWFEAVQTGLPMTALSALVGPARLSEQARRRLGRYAVPWAIKCGLSCVDLMSVRYEDKFSTDLVELRRQLGFIEVPREFFDSKRPKPSQQRAQGT